MTLNAPFPWFGGKRRVAGLVWSRFGDVRSYNEPFAGSLAVLLGRPNDPRIETVNDLDCFICNAWRAIQGDPDGVAYYADWPVNEADLHARHRWLVENRPVRCMTDPTWYDVRIAGWWLWGQSLWIGSGWCEARVAPADAVRPETGLVNAKGVNVHLKTPTSRKGNGTGIHQKRFASPTHSDAGSGVHRQFDRNGRGTVHQKNRPHMTTEQGVTSRRWQGGGQAGGSGVHAPRLVEQIPDLAGDSGASGRGIHASGRSVGLYEYMGALSARLRRVRVCCGDWRRVLTPSVTTYIGTCAVFLDPPYAHDLRTRCYSEDHDISDEVRTWALEHGDNPLMRIALCGYEGEHEMPDTWEKVAWRAHGGYSRSSRGKANREKERIWFSPHCHRATDTLFG